MFRSQSVAGQLHVATGAGKIELAPTTSIEALAVIIGSQRTFVGYGNSYGLATRLEGDVGC